MSQRFCFYVKLEKGCFVLGVFTFLLASLMMVYAVAYMALEDQRKEPSFTTDVMKTEPHLLSWTFEINRPVIHVILGAVLLMGIFWMVFSLALIYGVQKNKPACVVSYFLFGIAISILFMLSAVLALLNKRWPFALCICVLTLGYIRCLASVYSAYDRMQQGTRIGDEEQLISDEFLKVDDD